MPGIGRFADNAVYPQEGIHGLLRLGDGNDAGNETCDNDEDDKNSFAHAFLLEPDEMFERKRFSRPHWGALPQSSLKPWAQRTLPWRGKGRFSENAVSIRRPWIHSAG
jgi:hypothetical protein